MFFRYLFFVISFFTFAQDNIDSLANAQIIENYQKGLSFLYKNSDSTQYYLWKGYQIADKHKMVDEQLTILSQLLNSTSYNYKLKEVGDYLDIMLEVLEKSDNKKNDNLQKHWDFYKISSGNYYYKLKDYANSKHIFQELEKRFVGIDSLTERQLISKISVLEHLASIHKFQSKYSKSEEYYNELIRDITLYKYPYWETYLAQIKYKLGQNFTLNKQFKKAEDILLETIAFFSNTDLKSTSNNTLKAVYQTLIENYISQENPEIAITYIKEINKYYNDEDPFKKQFDVLAGDAFLQKKDFQKSKDYYQKAMLAFKAYRNQQKHEDIAAVYAKLANLENEQSNYAKSLDLYQQALIQLSNDFEKKDLKFNPEPEKVFSKLELVKILKEKLETLNKAYHKDQNLKWLNISRETAYDLISTLDLLKPEFESKVDKQFLINELYPSFYAMVEMAFQQFDKTEDQTFIEDAFHFMEKSKSILLLEAVRSAQASDYAAIPDEIINKEKQYRALIAHLETKQFVQNSQQNLTDSLFNLKNEYYKFIKDLEEEFPKYYELKYDTEVVSLESVSNFLTSDKALISFMVASDALYAIVKEKTESSFYKIPFSLKQKGEIKEFYEMISSGKVQNLEQVYQKGYSIYNKLFKKIIDPVSTNKLLIIPDDLLHYLPFEALTVSLENKTYLIDKFQICYANSLTLLKEQNKKIEKRNKLIAFAPEFDNSSASKIQEMTRSDFGPLLHNTEEANLVSHYFDGKSVTGKAASLQSFKENVTNYNLLHFATHAAANDVNPDYSYLAFTSQDQDKAPELLYVKDLYILDISADMVALSACQTGLGRLQKGEGMLSLSRGFSYAGARSLINTLWKIDDGTTAKIMADFYAKLDEAQSKDEALRSAKLNYLQSVDDDLLKHPYYWSAFKISGDVSPLNSKFNFWWLILALVPILVVLIIWKVRKNQSN